MDITKIVVVSLVSTLIISVIKPQKKEFALTISIICGVLIFSFIFSYLKSIIDTINAVMERFNLDTSMFVIIMKIIFVAYICEFGANICRDAGESAIASKVELGGKIIIVYLSLPVIEAVINLLTGFLQ